MWNVTVTGNGKRSPGAALLIEQEGQWLRAQLSSTWCIREQNEVTGGAGKKLPGPWEKEWSDNGLRAPKIHREEGTLE